jgi:hypothetical protein
LFTQRLVTLVMVIAQSSLALIAVGSSWSVGSGRRYQHWSPRWS